MTQNEKAITLHFDMDITEFAEQMEVTERTVKNWLAAGLVPGAEYKLTLVPRKAWVIPARAVKMCKPQKGQPPKIKTPKTK